MDPLLSLAFGMHSNRGVYALLLGSGISTSAAIPTGWDIVLELTRKLGAISGEADVCAPDPEAWYIGKFGEEPTYGGLLKRVSRTPSERQQLLRGYFEATPDEERDGLKQPTKAHKAIAELTKSGHVRLILTTNFDRLLERSLESVGVSPTVLSTTDAIDGAVPLTHATCTVIKLHGDYLDTRIRNSPEELAKYPQKLNRLLDRVFDEFGLVVCGWSADWDEALRAALTRCKGRRFTTYWAARGQPADAAKRLIEMRSMQVISIADADSFFGGVHEKVLALESFATPHPLSVRTAVAALKRYLTEERHRIELHDLVSGDIERVAGAIADDRMPVSSGLPPDQIKRRIREYEGLTAILASLIATGCQWGEQRHARLWTATLERLANRPATGGFTNLILLRRYPALLLLYVGGVASMKAMNMVSLRALLIDSRLDDADGSGGSPAVERLIPGRVVDSRNAQDWFADGKPRYTPVSDHLFAILRETLRDVCPSEDDYENAFDRFEYFVALLHADRRLVGEQTDAWCPLGRFSWKGRRTGVVGIEAEVALEAEAAGEAWPPIVAGLFTSIARFRQVAAVVAANVARARL